MKIVKVWIKPTTRKKNGKIEKIKGHYSTKFLKEKKKMCKAITKVTRKRCQLPAYLQGYCMGHYQKNGQIEQI